MKYALLIYEDEAIYGDDKDGSILVSDDWAGAIYRISYKK